MKLLIAATIFVCCSFSARSQFSESFGRITIEEINLKECSFDKEAEAIILLNEGSADYDNNYDLLEYKHIRIKVLKKEGIKYGNVSVPFYSDGDFESLDDLKAMTVNTDENGRRVEIPVDKKTVFFRKINAYYSEMSFALPQVNVGSILEYKYRSVKKNFSGLKEWNFQAELPVVKSSFFLKPPPNLEFTYSVSKRNDYDIKIESSKHEGTVYLEMNNIPGLGVEPYMDARKDYIQKINFQVTKFVGGAGLQSHMASWNEVARYYSTDTYSGAQLKVKVPDEQKLFIAEIEGKSEYERMCYIYNYIRRNYQWSQFNSIDAGDGLKTLYNKKTGTSGAINYALLNLLTEGKLVAYPMLVSERGHGKINTNAPFIKQFNNVYAVVFIGDKRYYLDATDLYSDPSLVPESILNTTALIIKRNEGILTDIKDDKNKYLQFIYINSKIGEDGSLNGNVQRLMKEYARNYALRLHSSDNRENVERITKGTANIKIDSLKAGTSANDSLAYKEDFVYQTNIQSSSDYSFLNINMFTGFESNPFISDKRFSNINFGSKQKIVFNHIIQLPKNMVVDALPKSIKMVNQDNTISFIRQVVVSAESTNIQARIVIELDKSVYTADEYPDIKEFYKKMIDLLNEQIVLKKS